MKVLKILLISILISACNSQNNDNEDVRPDSLFSIILNADSTYLKKENSENNEKITDNQEDICSDENLEFIKENISKNNYKFIENAIVKYSKIKTDKALAQFYSNVLDSVVEIICDAIWKYKDKNNTDDGELEQIWNDEIGNCMPFITIVFASTFVGTTAFKNYSNLLKKAKTTDGFSDNKFFEVMHTCEGQYPSEIYNYYLNDYDANYRHSLLGNGNHLAVIMMAIDADKESDLFDNELNGLVAYVLNIKEESVFGSSKEEVFKELTLISQIQDSTKFDLSNAEYLKNRLDTTSEKIHYNCANEDCSEYFN
ncbi:MAG: hypothetical protein JXR51_15775 [Bacteroidales bacterium]|nr:hypothetical protein [Bacteroidales bacterium]MBN2758629.1 hypothetical protein [Bacteroidales bacterium]